MKKKSKPFQMKQFEIHQDKCALKVGTDGILLGAWVNPTNRNRILDIGTGTGLISLMLAQRNQEAQIIALEIDESASMQASENFAISSWANRLNVEHTSLQDYQNDKTFDLIVSNPPFFNNALKSDSLQKNTARHTDTLSQTDLLQNSLRLLSSEGILALILPCLEAQQFTELAEKQNLFLQRKCVIQNTADVKPVRWLMEFSREKKEVAEESLIIREADKVTYTEAFKMLTNGFYIIF